MNRCHLHLYSQRPNDRLLRFDSRNTRTTRRNTATTDNNKSIAVAESGVKSTITQLSAVQIGLNHLPEWTERDRVIVIVIAGRDAHRVQILDVRPTPRHYHIIQSYLGLLEVENIPRSRRKRERKQ